MICIRGKNGIASLFSAYITIQQPNKLQKKKNQTNFRRIFIVILTITHFRSPFTAVRRLPRILLKRFQFILNILNKGCYFSFFCNFSIYCCRSACLPLNSSSWKQSICIDIAALHNSWKTPRSLELARLVYIPRIAALQHLDVHKFEVHVYSCSFVLLSYIQIQSVRRTKKKRIISEGKRKQNAGF